MNQLPAETIAAILVEARYERDDAAVAKRHGISDRTLRRYREQASNDQVLAELVQKKSAEVASEIHDDLVALVRAASICALELVQKARKSKKVEHLHSVIGALKIAKECLLEESVLNGPPRKSRPNPTPAAPTGSAGVGRGSSSGSGAATGGAGPIN